MKRILILLILIIIMQPSFAAGSKSYSDDLPTAGRQRSPVALTNLFTDILSWINGVYAGTGDASSANQALISLGNGTLSYTNVIRSNVDLEHTGGNGTTGQALVSNGDGTTEWASVGTLTDGDKTDITVASSGTVWTIDNGAVDTDALAANAVTSAKITNGTIATADIANGAVTTEKITNGTVSISDLGTTGYPVSTSTSTINLQTGTSYTVQDEDNGRIVAFNNGSAITVTIPDTVDNNFTCTVMQLGNGAVTVDNGGTLVLRNSLGLDTLLGRWSSASVLRVSNGTDLLLFGELAP